jgi:hypothetical protein
LGLSEDAPDENLALTNNPLQSIIVYERYLRNENLRNQAILSKKSGDEMPEKGRDSPKALIPPFYSPSAKLLLCK